MMNLKKRNKGFTLIELMIVVAIIAIIAAIAIPNLLRSRLQSNESATIGNLRTVLGAQVSYHADQYSYAADFATLTGATPPFLEGTWADPAVKSGYTLTINNADATAFACQGLPVTAAVTGNKGFLVNESGSIYYDPAGAVPDPAAANTIGE